MKLRSKAAIAAALAVSTLFGMTTPAWAGYLPGPTGNEHYGRTCTVPRTVLTSATFYQTQTSGFFEANYAGVTKRKTVTTGGYHSHATGFTSAAWLVWHNLDPSSPASTCIN